MAIEAANDAPVIAGQEVLITPEETALAIALADLQVVDPDNAYPGEFTLTVRDGADYGRQGNTITPPAEFNGTLTVPVVVNDGTTESNTYNLSVSVTAVNDAPVLDLDVETDGIDFATVFVEGGAPVPIVGVDGLSISDVDDAELASAQVILTNPADGKTEVLGADAGETGIAVVYDTGTGILTLSGPAALADFRTVLRTVMYENGSQDPDASDRVIEFTVNDGDAGSASAIAIVFLTDEIALEFQPGWNLCSLPFSTRENETPAELLVDGQGTQLFAGDVWAWDTQVELYKALAGAFVAQTGFWVFSPSEGVQTTGEIHGGSQNGELYLPHGWNLVGPVTDIALADVTGVDNVVAPVWAWEAKAQVYRAVPGDGGILKRGRGYWLFVAVEEGCWISTR